MTRGAIATCCRRIVSTASPRTPRANCGSTSPSTRCSGCAKTGHPEGTPKSQSNKGIDGLRCDFAQGLPSLFWEYTINKTRSVKWDFLFMAESLDGYREVNGNKRNGLSFRSARHFDILNENLVFYWRDQFFDYKPFGGTPFSAANSTTFPTWQAFDNRRNAYDTVPDSAQPLRAR
jgi:hypothetical protein